MDKTFNYKFYKDFLNEVCLPQLEIFFRNESARVTTDMDKIFSAKKSIEENPMVLEEFCTEWREYERGKIGTGLDYEFLFALLIDHGEYAREQAQKTHAENPKEKYEQRAVCEGG